MNRNWLRRIESQGQVEDKPLIKFSLCCVITLDGFSGEKSRGRVELELVVVVSRCASHHHPGWGENLHCILPPCARAGQNGSHRIVRSFVHRRTRPLRESLSLSPRHSQKYESFSSPSLTLLLDWLLLLSRLKSVVIMMVKVVAGAPWGSFPLARHFFHLPLHASSRWRQSGEPP